MGEAGSRNGEEPRETDGDRPSEGMYVTERVRLVRQLSRGGMGTVWVAEHMTLGSEVVVKFVLGRPSPQMAERLTREARLAARLVSPHAVRVYDQGNTKGGAPFIVMELLEGESLNERIGRAGALSLDEVRQLVQQVGSVLEEAHGIGVAHRDIKPHNLMLLATDQLFTKVLDFGIAKAIDEDLSEGLTAEGEVLGTPVYMAPEQLVDGKAASDSADLWGLAVVAYEALTGRRPFAGRTRAALGVAMLLGQHEPPSVFVPGLPAALDAWFAKAFSLEPTERFSNPRELAGTFEAAATDAKTAPPLPTSHEGRLRIPDRLYGRDAEIATLRRSFDEAASGRMRLALVSGYSGIGKTALVGAIEAPLAERGATFVGGKFDQFDRGTPYASLAHAFRGLVKQILASDDREVWRERIVNGVRENLAALTDVFDELEQLVGRPPPLDPAPPTEAQSRFLATMGRFVSALATRERPLVVFLDDLQWADLPSLELLASLVCNPESRHVLLIGTYRDNEVDENHPLHAMLKRVRHAGAHLDEIALGPLGEEAVLDLVSDATEQAPGRMRLAVECHGKTRGNAFFLRRFLESLAENGQLRHEDGVWRWDLSEIQAVPMAPSVVDFVADEMRRMPSVQRKALSVAACIGDQFDLGPLSFVMGIDRGAALASLRGALTSELVLPQTQTGWLTGPLDLARDRMSFRFAHDRIRQAARSLVDDDAAAQIHGQVGRFMLDHLDPSERERRLFEVVEHLNRGAPEEVESTGAARVLALNLAAARRALASAAFEPAWRYYQAAHVRLRANAWEDRYEETLAIHVEGARAAFLGGEHDAVDPLLDAALENAKSLLDRVSAQEVRIQALVSKERFDRAFELARPVIRELGVELSTTPTEEDVQAAIGATLAALEELGGEALLALPKCTDPDVIAAVRIQQEVMSSAYLVQPGLVPLLVANMVRATIEHGLCRESPYGFAVLALVLNSANMIPVAAKVGELALGLLDRLDDRAVRPSTLHIITCYVHAWTRPVRDSIAAERHVFQVAMDVGDLEYASWGLHVGLLNGLVSAVPLPELLEACARDVGILRYHRQRPALSCSIPIWGVAARLAGTEAVPPYDEAGLLASLEEGGFRGGVCVTASVGAYARLLLGEYGEAAEWAQKGMEHLDGAVGTYNGVLANESFAIATLAQAARGDTEAVARIAPQLEQLRVWRVSSEVNHAHRVQLVEAEVARVEGRERDARAAYAAASAQCESQGFTAERALSHLLASRFHREAGRDDEAIEQQSQARALFEAWGASAVAAQLG